jgi:hypothetical protein
VPRISFTTRVDVANFVLFGNRLMAVLIMADDELIDRVSFRVEAGDGDGPVRSGRSMARHRDGGEARIDASSLMVPLSDSAERVRLQAEVVVANGGRTDAF